LAFLRPIILCNSRHIELIDAQLAAIGVAPNAIVVEPFGRNTAAAAVVAAALAAELEPGACVLLAPADHLIGDTPAFRAALTRALPLAGERIVTFGLTPTRAETGYGYIEAGAPLEQGAFTIAKFHEKPDAETALAYVRSGGFYWNAGLFLFHPATLLAESAAAPEIRDGALAALAAGARRGGRIALDPARFNAVPSAPLDIAVMEKTRRGAVVPCDFAWADMGSWHEVWRLAAKDVDDNAAMGQARFIDAHGNLVHSDGPQVAALGVDDLIIVASGGVVLVAPRSRAQEIRAFAQRAQEE
jgi:mannose-1-phosphate guanylyltransferase/mannose-6-phosphate isomerase